MSEPSATRTLLAGLIDRLPPAPGSWTNDAACAPYGNTADAWDATRHEDALPAERICRRCPVRSECLAYAIATGAWGVWGGQVVVGGRVRPWPADLDDDGRGQRHDKTVAL